MYKKLGKNFDVIIKTRIAAIPNDRNSVTLMNIYYIHTRMKETFILKSNSDLGI